MNRAASRIFRKLWNVVLVIITALAVAGLTGSVCVLAAARSWEAFFLCMACAAWLTVFALANEGGTEHE